VTITAEFVTSAADARGFPRDGLPEVALVGRSNVGKSSLINALVGRRVARTSAAPGKTRLANVYRVQRGSGPPLYLVDLPGYGYARGGEEARREFDALARAYFSGQARQAARASQASTGSALPAPPGSPVPPARAGLLLVDCRHPGLKSDADAWQWLKNSVDVAAVVATKIDKLPRGQRIRATRELESVLEHPVLPVSAATGEGLDELWKLMDRLASSRKRSQLRNNNSPSSRNSRPPRAMAPRRPAPNRVEGPKR
jgi:GTP-binding protein